MWICQNNAFVSIVDKSNIKGCLIVRARREGDIERAIPGAVVRSQPGTDYLYRADVPREVVAKAIADSILDINYDNFKDSVRDDRLHTAYAQVWRSMANLQSIPPYSRGPAPAKKAAKPAALQPSLGGWPFPSKS